MWVGKIKSNAEYESSEANEGEREREYFLEKNYSKLMPRVEAKFYRFLTKRRPLKSFLEWNFCDVILKCALEVKMAYY